MFKNLTDFSYKRNWQEAIGFYLAYLLLGMVLAGIAGALTGILSGANTFSRGFNQGLGVGATISVVFSLIISGLLLKEKKLFRNFGYVLLILLGGILAVGGLLLGLVIPAFISTRGATVAES